MIKKLSKEIYALIATVILGGILLDRLTKHLAVRHLEPIGSLPLWKGVLHLTYVENTGAAFGMMKNARWIFLLFSAVAILGIAAYLLLGYARGRMATTALSLIVSGGIGNMIDRLLFGYVVDFIDFRLINFAVFNVADSFVCIGAGLLVLALILDLLRERQQNKHGGEGTP